MVTTKSAQKKRATEKRKKAREVKAAIKKLDTLMADVWRLICYERAGRTCECPGCGRTFQRGDFQLQAHHVIKRSQSKRLQLDPLNSLALCAGHHQYADRDQAWGLAIVNELRGCAEYLLRARRDLTKVQTHSVICGLLREADLHAIDDPKIDELRSYAEP